MRQGTVEWESGGCSLQSGAGSYGDSHWSLYHVQAWMDCKANHSLAETVPTWLRRGRAAVVLAGNGNQDLAAHVTESQEATPRTKRLAR